MPETLQKLRPDRDLQCYFFRPSAIAALSSASATGFTVSGTWRQQFDWAVIEWNRDNVFEHPFLRNLPDGDLSGVVLSYEETRQNCIPMDSTLFATVDWPSLRVWAESGGVEKIYFVPLKNYATPVAGSYTPASATFTLSGTITSGDYIEIAWEDEHYTYQLTGGDTLQSAVQALVDAVNSFSSTMSASRNDTTITITHAIADAGHNGNRIGAYVNASGSTQTWSPASATLSGGTSPTKWRVDLNFGDLVDRDNVTVPTAAVRKMRWTYAADFQAGAYTRSEFQVVVSNWSVTGAGLGYHVAGPRSRRAEDDSADLIYGGSWSSSRGNFSGGSIHYTTAPGASVSFTYTAAPDHTLYLGTRRAEPGGIVSVVVDGGAPDSHNLFLAGEDVLVRIPLGNLIGGVEHTVTVTHTGAPGSYFYLDFFEVAVPASELPEIPADDRITLATDWDTDHSLAIGAERTAWLIRKLGFTGRANHYVGALLFYELVRQGHSYASGTVTFSGTPVFSEITSISLGLGGSTATLDHVNLIADTAESIAKAFELRINSGFTGVRASSSGAVLTIYSRQMGAAGNSVTLSASPASGGLTATASGSTLTGGTDGNWRTDLTASPRVNRAARDWSRSFYTAMTGYGIEVAAAFSMELEHGDPDPAAGIAQRYNDGSPVLLNTPALQTNFSPTSLAFWREVYRDMADVMAEAGLVPYLQFGEVQWWYFPWDSNPASPHDSLPFYDTYTTSAFATAYGRPMHVFADAHESIAGFPEEAAFLPGLIGAFTGAVMSFIRTSHPAARFEVLYPPDVNDFPVTRVVNLPGEWNPSNLDCLKTENFTFTGLRNMIDATDSIELPMTLGFDPSRASHLIGIGDYTTPWLAEALAAKAHGVESIVLFALDQFCLIGYKVPLEKSSRRSLFMAG